MRPYHGEGTSETCERDEDVQASKFVGEHSSGYAADARRRIRYRYEIEREVLGKTCDEGVVSFCTREGGYEHSPT